MGSHRPTLTLSDIDLLPEFAPNNIKDYEDGQPIDIPAGRFVDLRVQMPGAEEIEPTLTKA